MSLSISRQQFLSYEANNAAEEIQYGRKGGIFVTTWMCVSLVILACIGAALAGALVYYVTYFKLSQTEEDIWNDSEPFGEMRTPSEDLRLPSAVTPSFYRLKLKPFLKNSTVIGDVAITIKANEKVREIILHSKDLTITNAKLMEQLHEKVEMYSGRAKRDASETSTGTNTKIKTDSLKPESNTTAVLTTLTESKKPESNATSTPTASAPVTDLIATFKDNGTTKINAYDSTTAVPTDVPLKVSLNATLETATNTTVPHNHENRPSVLEQFTVEVPKSIDTEVTVNSVKVVKITSISTKSGDRLVIELFSHLKPGSEYILELSFETNISDSLIGFYKSSYTTSNNEVRELGVTQFEPTSARAAFPCFDEPQFKAKFEISIAHPKNLTALSNMKLASQEDIMDQPQWQWSHFERSVAMSTYLVAYVISDFRYNETTYLSSDNLNKTIRIWTRPDFLHKTQYALSITPTLLKYFETMFRLPYALDKLDMVAVPDFSSGAMENWGLITFRETSLLYLPTENSPRDKQAIAVNIAHELGHQWFGNLVTMNWWSDVWLNEGFATYVEYVAVNEIEPEWNLLEQFTADKMDLMKLDARKNTMPVSRNVTDAAEISQKFDEISYLKGATLIRMLNHTLSQELFQAGLNQYLQEWKFQNADENSLWSSMAHSIANETRFRDVSTVGFMDSWTRQAGYPVVHVNRNYSTGLVTFEQQLYSTSSSSYEEMSKQLWKIPISYATVGSGHWSTAPKLWLNDRSLSVALNATDKDVLYVNVDAIGYYRVNYDTKNWQALTASLKKFKLPSVMRAQLIDDAFNLAQVGLLDYNYAFGLTKFLVEGDNAKIVWFTTLSNFMTLRSRMRTLPGYEHFQEYIKILIKKQLEKLNYGLNPPKDHNEALLIENLLSWECLMESERCIDWARKQFSEWTSRNNLTDNPIPSYLRPLVYTTALYHGGMNEFQTLWGLFLNSTDPNIQSVVASSLGSTREEAAINMLLEKSLTEIPKQYAVSVWSFETTIGSKLAQDFLYANWERVNDVFGRLDDFAIKSVINEAFRAIATRYELDRLKSFSLQHKPAMLRLSQTLQKIVDISETRIEWIGKYSDKVVSSLKSFIKAYKDGTLNSFNIPDEPQADAPILIVNDLTKTNTSTIETPNSPYNTSVEVSKNITASEKLSETSKKVSETSKKVSETSKKVSETSKKVSESSERVSESSEKLSETSKSNKTATVTLKDSEKSSETIKPAVVIDSVTQSAKIAETKSNSTLKDVNSTLSKIVTGR